MNKMIEWLSGKKTYINAALIGIAAAAEALGYSIPNWVFAVLGALGLSNLRLGVAKAEKEAKRSK